MSRKFVLLFFLILSIALISEVSAQIGGSKVLGGWQDIKDPRDPTVVEIGRFAVGEHNKKTPGLKLALASVIKGQYQVVSGVNYKLTLAARDTAMASAAPRNYVAVVYDKPWAKVRQLISFEQA